MTHIGEKFLENSHELQEQGLVASSDLNGMSIKMTGTQRRPVVLMARALTERLTDGVAAEYSGRRFDFMLSSALTDVGLNLDRERYPLFETRPADGAFSVRIEDAGDGNMALTAEVRDQDNPDNWRALQVGYIAIMNGLELVSRRDPLEQSVEDVLKQTDVEVRGSTKTSSDVKIHRESDIEAAPAVFKLLGVKEADDIKLLRELWVDRSLDKVALVDLFLHVVEEKQSFIDPGQSELYPEIELKDLVEMGRHLPATDLRGDQQKKSAKVFAELGFDPKDTERRFINADKDRALAFRYVAWLSGQSFMAAYKQSIKENLAKGNNVPPVQLFVQATERVARTYKAHKDNDYEKPYDLSIDWQAKKYQAKLEFLKTCTLLCMNVFFDKDVTKLTQDR